ncbi:methylaspartate mutase [Kineosporia mesophila]|uniref:Methylaspartate mutase n=1 Tax=Kineosporia mesophila TaxID=566012 RepID=A0ABP6ZDU8_9ACTN|nr:hypothetical protein [Kineosporia mesophila]
MTERHSDFGRFVHDAHERGDLVVQPRMGYGDPGRMRAGLAATRQARATTVGTITLDSYTRTGQVEVARQAVERGDDLNGYPIVTHDPDVTGAVLAGLAGPGFPVQVRHGSAQPQQIIAAALRAGLTATEGGPVSYCLPYSRLPLRDSVRNWSQACDILVGGAGAAAHVETFGGCMLGQLCPPGLLVAISVLEGLFLQQHGVRSLSLSYAQQTSPEQDEGAVLALNRLAAELLPGLDLHTVIYGYMGLFPQTPGGARALMADAAGLAVRTGAQRLIVKTAVEAQRIPTIGENVEALEHAAAVARRTTGPADRTDRTRALAAQEVYQEAGTLISAVLELGPDVGSALVRAFDRGVLDIPYCLHPANSRRSTSYLDGDGWLRWGATGGMPLPPSRVGTPGASGAVTSAQLLRDLSYMQRRYDRYPSLPVPAPELVRSTS